MLTWTPKVSLEVNDKFSGQTGQRGGRGYNVSDTSHVSPTTARPIASQSQTRSKSRKGVMVRAQCVEYILKFGRGVLYTLLAV